MIKNKDLKNVRMSPGLILCKPYHINPRERMKGSGLYTGDKSITNATYNQLDEIYDEHPFQAEILLASDLSPVIGAVPASGWLKHGDNVCLNREIGAREAVIIEGFGVCAYIRPSDIICVTPKKENKVIIEETI